MTLSSNIVQLKRLMMTEDEERLLELATRQLLQRLIKNANKQRLGG